MKRRRKTDRRKREHFATGSAMNIDRRQHERRTPAGFAPPGSPFSPPNL